MAVSYSSLCHAYYNGLPLGELTSDEVAEALHLCWKNNWQGDITVRMSLGRVIQITQL